MHNDTREQTMATQPPFALHPADVIPGVIDLTTREGIKLYQNATWSFYSDPADCFNCEAPGLHGFLKEVEGTASCFGWRDNVPTWHLSGGTRHGTSTPLPDELTHPSWKR